MTEVLVVENTFSFDEGQHEGELYEAGGIYEEIPPVRGGVGHYARQYVAGERVLACPRCGQRFADTTHFRADANLQRHLEGDEDIPTICAWKVPA